MKPDTFETEIRKLSKTALRELKKMMKSDDDKIRMEAIKMVFERGYGTPAKTARDPWIEEFESQSIEDILSNKDD